MTSNAFYIIMHEAKQRVNEGGIRARGEFCGCTSMLMQKEVVYYKIQSPAGIKTNKQKTLFPCWRIIFHSHSSMGKRKLYLNFTFLNYTGNDCSHSTRKERYRYLYDSLELPENCDSWIISQAIWNIAGGELVQYVETHERRINKLVQAEELFPASSGRPATSKVQLCVNL